MLTLSSWNLTAQSSLLYYLSLPTNWYSLKWNLQAIGNRCESTLKGKERCANAKHYYYYQGEKGIYICIAFLKKFGSDRNKIGLDD